MKERAFLFLAAVSVLLAVACNMTACKRIALTAEEYQARGLNYLENGDYESAIADFTQAINLKPDYAEAYSKRADAFEELSSAYADKGDWYLANWARDVAFSDRADWDILTCTEAILLYPNDGLAYIDRGYAYAKKGDYDSAIADFTQLIRLYPNYYGTYNARGYAKYVKGDYDSAIADFTYAISLNPNYAEAYNNRGLAYRARSFRSLMNLDDLFSVDPTIGEDEDRAIADFNQAISINPNFAEAYLNRGDTYGRYNDHAILDYTQTIRLDPNYAKAYFNRGKAYADKGDYDNAIADFTQIIMLDPNYAEAYSYRGRVYAEKRDYDRAVADYETALRLDPNDYFTQEWLEDARRTREQ